MIIFLYALLLKLILSLLPTSLVQWFNDMRGIWHHFLKSFYFNSFEESIHNCYISHENNGHLNCFVNMFWSWCLTVWCCVLLITFDLDLRVAGGRVLWDGLELEEGGEPGSWLGGSGSHSSLVFPECHSSRDRAPAAPPVLPRLGRGRRSPFCNCPGAEQSAQHCTRPGLKVDLCLV